MTEVWSYVFTGALGATIVVAIKEIILWKLNRKATVEDTEKMELAEKIQAQLCEHKESIDKVMGILEQLESKLNISMSSERVILKDRIKYVAVSYIRTGEISFEDKKSLNEMWNIYHYGLGGNGDLDDIMKLIEELPLII